MFDLKLFPQAEMHALQTRFCWYNAETMITCSRPEAQSTSPLSRSTVMIVPLKSIMFKTSSRFLGPSWAHKGGHTRMW